VQDVVDLMEFMFGTGLRIGEALGLAADAVDLQTGTLEVCQIAVRLSGQATILQPWPKTEAGWLIISLPTNVVALCRRGIASIDNPDRLLFPGPRNPSNANRDMKVALLRANPSLGWVTSHTCRKTVAPRLDEAGLSAREIADHLGHAKPSMTQDVYMGRGVATAAAVEALAPDGALSDRTATKCLADVALTRHFVGGGGGGNRTRVLQRRVKTSPGAVC